MLDFGISELLVIAALAVIVIGPKELPTVMLMLGRIVRRFQYIRYVFTSQFDEFMEDADLKGLRTSVNFEADDEGVPSGGFDEGDADEEFMRELEVPDESE